MAIDCNFEDVAISGPLDITTPFSNEDTMDVDF
jgi:hypothetical protein